MYEYLKEVVKNETLSLRVFHAKLSVTKLLKLFNTMDIYNNGQRILIKVTRHCLQIKVEIRH